MVVHKHVTSLFIRRMELTNHRTEKQPQWILWDWTELVDNEHDRQEQEDQSRGDRRDDDRGEIQVDEDTKF